MRIGVRGRAGKSRFRRAVEPLRCALGHKIMS